MSLEQNCDVTAGSVKSALTCCNQLSINIRLLDPQVLFFLSSLVKVIIFLVDHK